MNKPQKLGDVIKEIMENLEERRKIETRIREGRASPEDHLELKAIDMRLQE